MVTSMPDGWEKKRYEDVFQQNRAALEMQCGALYPVVDQSKVSIKTYSRATGRPVLRGDAIVFGDHTRIVKYIPSAFLPDGDGVRVLYGKYDDSRFLAYYISGIIRVPDIGYSRHFKYLLEHDYRLPKLPEQRAIAEVLSGFDEHLMNLDELIAKKKAIRDGALEDLVIGKSRLDGFTKHWGSYTLGDLGGFRSGVAFPLKFQGKRAGEFPFFKVANLSGLGNERHLVNANHYVSAGVAKTLAPELISKNAIVFAKIGAAISLERKRLAHRACLIDNNMMAYIPGNACDPEFFLSLFRHLKLSEYIEQTALPSLKANSLRAISINLPRSKSNRLSLKCCPGWMRRFGCLLKNARRLSA